MEDKQTLIQVPPAQGQLKTQFGPKCGILSIKKYIDFNFIVMKIQIYKKPNKSKKKKRENIGKYIQSGPGSEQNDDDNDDFWRKC